MKLQDFMQLHDLQDSFSEVEVIVNNNVLPPRTLTILDKQCLDIPPQVLNVLVDTGRLNPMSAITSIPESQNVSWPDKVVVRNADDDPFYVGISRGSSQFFIATYSEINFYLYS